MKNPTDLADVPKAEDRAAYEPPAIAWEEAMDARPSLMAQCGKIGGTSDECTAAPAS